MADKKQAPAVTIYTKAYNVENYIRECAESVLNQTFNNFEWLVLDNGSTDKTGEILAEYVKRDSRIKLFKNFENDYIFNNPPNPDLMEYVYNLKSEYWCILDSDDYLHPDFLKELYTAAKEHDADIAVGGTEMFREDNPQISGTRCPPDFYSMDIKHIGDILPQVYGCFRPMWGKLVRVSIAQKQWRYRDEFPLNLKNGGDTIFCLDCLDFSASVVGINKVLHYYRVRRDSHYHSQLDKYRYLDYKIIYDESKKLLEKWDKLSSYNVNFISHVLYESLKDCIVLAANNSYEPIGTRLEVIESILSDKSIFEILLPLRLTDNLLSVAQKAINDIMENTGKTELSEAVSHYIYRLCKSFEMLGSTPKNRQNAFILYLSAICDEANTNHYGSIMLYSLLSLMEKQDLSELVRYGIGSEFLSSDPVLLRELINNNFDSAIKICENHSDNAEYVLLGKVLKRMNRRNNPELISEALAVIEKHISGSSNNGISDLLSEVLAFCPLDKRALCFMLQLEITYNDPLAALETAEVIRVFYPDDI